MAFREALFTALDKAVDPNNQSAFQKRTGIHQPTFHGIYTRKNTNPQLKAVEAIIDNLDTDTFIDFVKSIRPDLNIDVVSLEGKHEVPVYNIGEVNAVMHLVEEVKTRETLPLILRGMVPLFRVQVPEKFFPSDFALRQTGHSMEPDIPHNACVGFSYLKNDRDFAAGEIYLCELPFEGLVIRRVVVAQGQSALEFQALHQDKDAYRSQIMHPDEAISHIYARMKWVAYRK